MNNNGFGWTIFITIAINSGVNICFALYSILSTILSYMNEWKKSPKKMRVRINPAKLTAMDVEKRRTLPASLLLTDLNNSNLQLIEKENPESADQLISKPAQKVNNFLKEQEGSSKLKESEMDNSESESKKDDDGKLDIGIGGTLQDADRTTDCNKSELTAKEKKVKGDMSQFIFSRNRRTFKIILKREKRPFRLKEVGFVLPEKK